MIINSLHIYGFGKLSDVTITLNNGINVIEGKNEAGKSTIMAFIRAVFFGFAGRRSFHERYEPIHGGKFGGAIDLIDYKQEIYRIERIYQQKVAGDVKVILPNGEIVGEEYLPQLLGRINENVFKQIFCFGLSELQQIDLFQGSQINDFIYHAGTGSVNQILKMKQDLEIKKQFLFRSNGKKPIINELVLNLDSVAKSIEDLKQKNNNHDQYINEIRRLEQEISRLEEEFESKKDSYSWFALLERSSEAYYRIKEIKTLLKEYPEGFDFPENGAERLDAILKSIEDFKIEHQQLIEKSNEIKDRITELENGTFFEENSQTIANLKEQLNLYLEQLKSEQLIDIELKKVLANIDDEIIQIGSEYTEEKIRGIEFTLQSRQYVQDLANKIEEKEKRLTEIDKEIEITKKSLAKIQNVLQERQDVERKTQDNDQIKNIYPVISKHWTRLRENELQLKNLNDQKYDYSKQLKTAKKNSALLSFFAINGLSTLASIGLFLYFNSWLYAVILFGSVFIVSLLFQTYSSKVNNRYKKSIKNSIRALDSQIQNLEYEIKQIKEKSRNILTPFGFDELNEIILQKIDELRILNLQKEQLQQGEENRIKEYEQELKEHMLELKRLEEKKNNLSVEHQGLNSQWQDWLIKHNLDSDTSLNILNHLIAIIQKIKGLYNTRDNLFAQKEAIINNRNEYEIQVNALYEIIKDDNRAITTIPERVNYLSEQSKKAEQIKIANSYNSKQIEEINDRIDKYTKQIDLEEDKYNQLLKYGNASDKEEFYKLEKKYMQYRLLNEERQQQAAFIRNNCNDEARFERLLDELSNSSKQEVKAHLDRLNSEIKSISDKIKSYSEQKGEVQNKVKEIEEDSTLSELNQDYFRRSAELTNKVKEWTVYSLSKHILEKTMKAYEEEKQPLILQGATKYFSQMTGNEYEKVIASIDTNEIRVIRKDGVHFEPQYLSRGTVEQLFLAIRYALVEEYSKQKRLPIILDDIFVNFDSQRLINSLTTLQQLSENHQIIIFTCHTYLLSKIKFVVDEVNYYALS